jgi:aminopeptidase N
VLNTPLIELSQEKQSFRFRNVTKRPILSLNRGFSAPIKIQASVSPDDQLFLMGRDSDTFNRWEAGQSLAKDLIISSLNALRDGRLPPATAGYATALQNTLDDEKLDAAFKALMLSLPTEADIAAAIGKDVDTDFVLQSRDHVRTELGFALKDSLLAIWRDTEERGAYAPTPVHTGRRSLRYAALSLLAAGLPHVSIGLIQRDLATASNMTAEIGALTAMLGIDAPETSLELEKFYARHSQDHLLVDKWFALNAQIPGAGSAARIRKLMGHPDFRLSTPNRVYALIGGFTSANLSGFNAADGEGYRVVADTILKLDKINPQVAARMATGFRSWRILNEVRRKAISEQLEGIVSTPNLSRDTFEIISRTLKG